MFDWETWKHAAFHIGFSNAAPLDVATLELRQEVRDMCAANSCGQYGKNWSCPPACGELNELRDRIKSYRYGFLVQTIGEIEDSFDVEAMLEIEERHKEQMMAMQRLVKDVDPNARAIGVGCCTRCNTCTYPGQPCRFPDQQIVSMEAYGMVVNEICRANGMPYYYGSDCLAYTGCFLLR